LLKVKEEKGNGKKKGRRSTFCAIGVKGQRREKKGRGVGNRKGGGERIRKKSKSTPSIGRGKGEEFNWLARGLLREKRKERAGLRKKAREWYFYSHCSCRRGGTYMLHLNVFDIYERKFAVVNPHNYEVVMEGEKLGT